MEQEVIASHEKYEEAKHHSNKGFMLLDKAEYIRSQEQHLAKELVFTIQVEVVIDASIIKWY